MTVPPNGSNPAGATESSLLRDAKSWLVEAAELRHRRRVNPRDPIVLADTILSYRRAEELVSMMLGWMQGFEQEHAKVLKLGDALHVASQPGPDANTKRQWNIADEFAPGRGAAFRRALNAFVRYIEECKRESDS
jgi:hypothetical protein